MENRNPDYIFEICLKAMNDGSIMLGLGGGFVGGLGLSFLFNNPAFFYAAVIAGFFIGCIKYIRKLLTDTKKSMKEIRNESYLLMLFKQNIVR